MPKALVINPNTSPSMTGEIEETAGRIFAPPWTYVVAMAPAGPESLESWTDYHLASVCVLPLLEKHADADGVVLACFGDPGLYLLKESCDVPAIGIAEASMSISLMLGARFGILAGMGRAVELMDSMVRTYGLESRYAGTRSLEMRVLDFEKDRDITVDRLEQVGLTLRKRGAEVLILGCAGLTGFVEEVQQRLSIPIIDPVDAGCRMLQNVVASGLKTSHVGLYARPAPQKMIDLERMFTDEAMEVLRKPRHSG